MLQSLIDKKTYSGGPFESALRLVTRIMALHDVPVGDRKDRHLHRRVDRLFKRCDRGHSDDGFDGGDYRAGGAWEHRNRDQRRFDHQQHDLADPSGRYEQFGHQQWQHPADQYIERLGGGPVGRQQHHHQ